MSRKIRQLADRQCRVEEWNTKLKEKTTRAGGFLIFDLLSLTPMWPKQK